MHPLYWCFYFYLEWVWLFIVFYASSVLCFETTKTPWIKFTALQFFLFFWNNEPMVDMFCKFERKHQTNACIDVSSFILSNPQTFQWLRLQPLLAEMNYLLVFEIFYQWQSWILIRFWNGTHFKILIILKYSPLQPHSIWKIFQGKISSCSVHRRLPLFLKLTWHLRDYERSRTFLIKFSPWNVIWMK